MESHLLTATSLSTKNIGWFFGALVAIVIGAGVLILLARRYLQDDDASADKTLIRSWLSVALVSGLLLFAAGSFFIDDTNMRGVLMGGVIASAGTATAFYFASKASAETQKNLLSAVFDGPRTFDLPNLTGMSVAQARGVAAALRLTFGTDPQGAQDGSVIAATKPAAGTSVKPGDTVVATVQT
jgi:hypothetical protein